MSKNPKNEPSAKQQAIAARDEKAYQLIESGVKHSLATRRIQFLFGVGRSTAYNTVQEAQLRFEASQRNNPQISESQRMDVSEMRALFEYQLQEAFAQGDMKGMALMAKEIDRLDKKSAPCQTSSEPLQVIPGFGRADSVQEKQRQNDVIRSSVVAADRDTIQLTAIQQSKKAKELAKRERELDEREAALQ